MKLKLNHSQVLAMYEAIIPKIDNLNSSARALHPLYEVYVKLKQYIISSMEDSQPMEQLKQVNYLDEFDRWEKFTNEKLKKSNHDDVKSRQILCEKLEPKGPLHGHAAAKKHRELDKDFFIPSGDGDRVWTEPSEELDQLKQPKERILRVDDDDLVKSDDRYPRVKKAPPAPHMPKHKGSKWRNHA